MLRFGQKPSSRRLPTFGGPSRGVWKLLLLLGLVIVMIRQLDRPEAGVMLGRVLGIANQPAGAVAAPPGEVERVQAPATKRQGDAALSKPPLDDAWDVVKDNALFAPREQAAWFQLFERVESTPPEELSSEATPVTYVQLASQPDSYRAAPVRVRGRVLRESRKTAPENSAGIESYHQLWLAPVGGGDWPIVVYSLALPDGFPRGDGIAADVTVEGLFFKNWTFAYDGGMGIAPVIVTSEVEWSAPVSAKPQAAAAVDTRWLAFGIGGAALAATAFVVWAIRQTRRPRIVRTDRPVDLSHLEAGP